MDCLLQAERGYAPRGSPDFQAGIARGVAVATGEGKLSGGVSAASSLIRNSPKSPHIANKA